MFLTCRRKLWILYPAVLLALYPAAYAADSPAQPSDRQIAQWIKELSADEFAMRERASRHLWLAGDAAEPALKKASQNGDLETVRRARDILDKFRWGIYGDTPTQVAALIRTYKSMDAENSFDFEVAEKLIGSGISGLRAALHLAKNDTDSQRRNQFRDFVSQRALGLLQQVFDKVQDEIRCDWFVTLAGESGCLSPEHFAAYWFVRGQLDDRIRVFRARLDKNPADQLSSYTLAYLYRAKGDLAEARKIAEREKFDGLLTDILVESADWKTLAARPKPMGLYPIDQASYRASFARLSGNRKQFEAALADLKKLSHGQEAYYAGLALIANGHPSEGIKLLADSERYKHSAFLALCNRLQYREALSLVQKTPADDSEKKGLEVRLVRLLSRLGEQDKADVLIARLGEKLREGRAYRWSSELLGVEREIGLKDRALGDCARLLAFPEPRERWEPDLRDYLWQVFPDSRGAALFWFQVLRRKFPEETPLAVLHRLRDLLEGKIAKATVKEWIEEAQKELGPLKVKARSERLIDVAEVAIRAGLNSLASSLLEKADTPESCFRLGDLLAGNREWKRAAECYRQAWRKDLQVGDGQDEDSSAPLYGVGPLPLYLAGDALVKAGRKQEGKRLIKQAHLWPLGDVEIRYGFFEALRERGHRDAAQREYTLAARLTEAKTLYFRYGMAMYQLGRIAAVRKDYFQAARDYEQAMFSDCSNFNPIGAARISSEIHRLRACGLLMAGKDAEACKQIDLALIAWPANSEVANALVPELERRGRKKEADALFDRCLQPHEKTCRDYPHCATSHNNAAWLMACCRRDLDKAREYAEKAVKLAPANANYFGTLSEVYFQRGDKDKAIAAVKRAVELEPRKSYYRQQLKRLQAGDPTAERPPENDE